MEIWTVSSSRKVTKKVNKTPVAKTKDHGSKWAEIIGPIVSKLHAGHAFGTKVELEPEGALALARLLAAMARTLDSHKDIQEMPLREFMDLVAAEKSRRGIDNL